MTEGRFSNLRSRIGSTKIICLGLSALDQIWTVEEGFEAASHKVRATTFETTGGGMAATAAVTVATLGARAAFWGRAGEDAAGHEMRDMLAAADVDVTRFRLFPGGRSSVSGIVVDRTGERQIVNFRGRFPEEADWLPLDEIADASAVMADPRWVEGAAAAFAAGRAAGVPTILDADVAEAPVFERLLPLTDHAIFSEPALRRFAGEDLDRGLADVAARGCLAAAVTQGEAGVLTLLHGRYRRTAAFRVDVLDTTGAGDVFHGAYAVAIGARLGVDDALSFAAAAAALKCTRAGGRSGIPSLDDTLDLLRTTA